METSQTQPPKMTIRQRVEKLARIRCAFEQLRAGAALFFADELDINLLAEGRLSRDAQGRHKSKS